MGRRNFQKNENDGPKVRAMYVKKDQSFNSMVVIFFTLLTSPLQVILKIRIVGITYVLCFAKSQALFNIPSREAGESSVILHFQTKIRGET